MLLQQVLRHVNVVPGFDDSGLQSPSDETMMFSLFGGYVINTFVLIALGQMKMAN